MMRTLTRWSTTIGAVAVGIMCSGVVGQNLKAWALPEDAILEKLNQVPVFTITDDKGVPLVVSREDNAEEAGVFIFISQETANSYVSQLQTKNPDLAEQAKVVLVSLGQVYKLSESNESKENNLSFAYIPDEEAVNSAQTVLDQSGQTYQGGVPLFAARVGQDNGYITFEKDSQQVIPFFFEKEQVENLVAKFKEQEPDVADSVNIEVVPLEGVISTLQTDDNEMLDKIILVPSAESLRFLQQQNNAAPAPGAQPAPAPEAQPAE